MQDGWSRIRNGPGRAVRLPCWQYENAVLQVRPPVKLFLAAGCVRVSWIIRTVIHLGKKNKKFENKY